MSLKDKFLAWLDSQSPDAGNDEKPTVPNIPAVPPPPPAQSAQTAKPDPEVESLREQIRTMQAAQIQKDSIAFADRFIKTESRAFPAERDKIVAAYTQAAIDDSTSPLKEGSRVANLEAAYSARPQHRLTTEQIESGKVIVLPSARQPEEEAVKEEIAAAEAYAKKANKTKSA